MSRRELVPTEPESSVLLDPAFCEQAIALAKLMSAADSLPQHLKGKPADLLRVIEMAHRAKQSPFAVADATYFVGGKIAFEGKLVAALINSHPLIVERLNYEYTGDETKPETLSVVVTARIRDEDKARSVKCTWVQGDTQSKGAKDKWRSQPAQQLAYYGARVWARRHAPEILLGLYTPDEMEAGHIGPEHAKDVSPASTGVGRARFVPAEPEEYDPGTGEVYEDASQSAAGPPGQAPPPEQANGGPSPASPAGGPAEPPQRRSITKAQLEALRERIRGIASSDDYFALLQEHGELFDSLRDRNSPAWPPVDSLLTSARLRLGLEPPPQEDLPL